MKKSFPVLFFTLLLSHTDLIAHPDNQDFMRSIGKMYVVYGVIVVIFAALIIFLIYLDRRLTKLENQINDQ
jgi:heme export protein D (CcmD)